MMQVRYQTVQREEMPNQSTLSIHWGLVMAYHVRLANIVIGLGNGLLSDQTHITTQNWYQYVPLQYI